MTITDVILRRHISEVLHYTTQQGLTGILHERSVKARNLLPETRSLEYILKINTQKVFDPAWKSYVNLSISRLNVELFKHSLRWHPEQEWRILSFNPTILTHPGVKFVTTNNAYWQHLKRGTGVVGLEQMFADEVISRCGKRIMRPADYPSHWTTDVQAEVLYPHEVSTDHLRRVYVQSSDDADSVAATRSSLLHPAFEIVVDPSRFQDNA